MNPPIQGVASVADLRELARRRLPKMVFDYIDGGAEDERTMTANQDAFGDYYWRPKSAVVHEAVDISTQVLGQHIPFPAILAPVGSTRMFWPRGEEAAARAAGNAGTIYTLSTLSGTRLEEVAAATKGNYWYQLYLCGGREVALAAIERARASGYSALVVTIDTPVAGMRERDVRNGSAQLIAGDLPQTLPYVHQVLARPRWIVDFLREGGIMTFPNVVLPDGPMGYRDVGAQLAGAALTWADFDWIRDVWRGPLVTKGIHSADDALRAVDAGADAIVVSNHGGRQLDGVQASLRILPEVIAAVPPTTEVLMDGGVRSGADIAKAIALGARAVLIGRAYAYGLAAGGHAGVTTALAILRNGVERTMQLLGCPSVSELNGSYLSPR